MLTLQHLIMTGASTRSINEALCSLIQGYDQENDEMKIKIAMLSKDDDEIRALKERSKELKEKTRLL